MGAPTNIGLILFLMCGALSYGHAQERLRDGSLDHNGLKRTFLLYVPAIRPDDRTQYPLIIVLHGGGGTGRGMVKLTRGRFDELADQDGFYVVYPDGVNRSWNDGRTDRALAGRGLVDDVGFVKALIENLSHRYGIDTSRVCVAGISNGGMMALKLGCSSAIKITLVAAVAASMPDEILPLCHSVKGVSLALFDGTEDPIIPFQGGEVKILWKGRGKVVSVDSTFDWWTSWNRCSGPIQEQTLAGNDVDGTSVLIKERSGCTPPVVVREYCIVGGGHTWPGGIQYLGEWLVGKTTSRVNACDEIVRLMQNLLHR